jgi:glutamate-5-semialdehyde dehydrogenase
MIEQAARAAREACAQAPAVGDPAYRSYCRRLADQLTARWPQIRKANEQDVAAAEQRGMPPALVDRLRLTDAHLDLLTHLADDVCDALPAVTAPGPELPIGQWGSRRQLAKPLGVVLMVYEARPTATIEGALLCVATGNAVLLRGGKEIAPPCAGRPNSPACRRRWRPWWTTRTARSCGGCCRGRTWSTC